MSEASHANGLYCQISDLQKQLATVTLERDAIRKMLMDVQQECIAKSVDRRILLDCVRQYADNKNWWCSTADSDDEHDCATDATNCVYDEWVCRGTAHGYELAQVALRKVVE